MGDKELQNSILLIDKPVNKTSYQTIEEIKGLVKAKKIGHSGTLDKFASGLLIVCTGYATRLTRYFLDSDKRYIGIFKLGVTTDTLDREGEIVEKRDLIAIEDERIFEIKGMFSGEIFQVPPKFSALKIKGKRASDLVREGKDVELSERRVHIRAFDLYKVEGNKSLLRFDITCSKGTYIRSIARDVGIFLNTGAFLDELRRINSGNFSVRDSVTLGELKGFLDGECIGKKFHISPVDALSDFGLIVVDNRTRKRVLNGAFFLADDIKEIITKRGKPFRILDEEKNLIAIANIEVEKWKIKYMNVFN